MKKNNRPSLKLRNPPSVEAVIDIRVKPGSVKADSFSILDDAFRKRFPTQDKIRLLQGALGPDTGLSYQESPLGYLYKSADGSEQIQFRINGFSYHRLGHYPGWPTFFKEAQKCWKYYFKHGEVTEVDRLGLRYINQIKVGGLTEDLRDTLKVFLHIPPRSKIGNLERYEYKFVTKFKEKGLMANVQLVPTANTLIEKTTPSVILDIDVFHTEIRSDINAACFEEYFASMRQAKNDIFLSLLTTKTMRAFK